MARREGSALWPEFVSDLASRSDIGAVWLTASDELFRERIYRESEYERAGQPQQELIDKFVLRTLAYNRRMREALERLDLPCIRVHDTMPDELADLVTRYVEVGR